MPWALASAAVSVVGSIGSAITGSNAAKSAARAQAAAAAKASAEREKGFGQVKEQLGQYAALGTSALPKLSALAGTDGSDPEGMMNALRQYPGYQFALSEGAKLVGNQQQGFGSRDSGNAMRAISDYGQNTASSLYQSAFNNMMGLTDVGFKAAGGIANAAINKSTGVAEDIVGAGNAKAAGRIGSANAISGGISGTANAIGGLLGNTGFQGYASNAWSGAADTGGALNSSQLSRTPDGHPGGYYVRS